MFHGTADVASSSDRLARRCSSNSIFVFKPPTLKEEWQKHEEKNFQEVTKMIKNIKSILLFIHDLHQISWNWLYPERGLDVFQKFPRTLLPWCQCKMAVWAALWVIMKMSTKIWYHQMWFANWGHEKNKTKNNKSSILPLRLIRSNNLQPRIKSPILSM